MRVCAVFGEQGTSAFPWAAAKFLDAIARFPDNDGSDRDATGAHTQAPLDKFEEETGIVDAIALEDNVGSACMCYQIIENMLDCRLLRQQLWHLSPAVMRSLLLELGPAVAAGLAVAPEPQRDPLRGGRGGLRRGEDGALHV